MVVDSHTHIWSEGFLPSAFFREAAAEWATKVPGRAPGMILPRLIVSVAARPRAGSQAGIVRVNSILPARAPGRAGVPLFSLMNYQHARRDSTPKIAYTYLP
jgi:hypothetical protein